MKRILISIVVAIMTATAAYAQDVYVATLNHEGTITEYYGAGAFNKACKEAVNGDIITLSPGEFATSSIILSKAVTIRGAGIVDDIDQGLTPTIISSINFNISDTNEKLQIEGVVLKGTTNKNNTLNNSVFRKCSFDNGCSGTFSNCIFTDCYIYKLEPLSSTTNTIFNNCFIVYPGLGSSGSYYYYNGTFFNCFLVTASNTNIYPKNCSFANCILALGYSLDVSNKAENCVGINIHSGRSVFGNLPSNPTCVYGKQSMFKSWSDASSRTNLSAASFELSDNGKVYVGADGTEIGMLGGNYPYNPVVSIPRITKCEVANKATADGKLSVNIEVTAPTAE